jgi:uncharacterized protein (UPF0254 family)
MSPKKLVTRRADLAQGRARRKIAEKYLDVACLVAEEDGAAINVCVGLAVLAGIAAGDAVCIAATGERYAGQDHDAAAELLERVDAEVGKRLRQLIAFKPSSHYGDQLLSDRDRKTALRCARVVVEAAAERIR